MVTVQNNPEKFVVTQSNDLIEANYSSALTARAHKVARLIFSLISPEDPDLKLYTIEVDALKRFLGYKHSVTWGRFHDDLKDIATRLNSEPIIIKTGKNKTITAFFIAAYELDWKKGFVTFEVPTMLKPFLIELKKNFTKYPLTHIPKLNSSYSIRLYELLYQYKTIGNRVFDLEDLQKKIGSSYDKYSHFKSRVLKIAQRDLKTHTDIRFEYDEIKAGRKVVRLEFFIYNNSPKKENTKQGVLAFLEEGTETEDKPVLSSQILDRLQELGITRIIIEQYLREGFRIIQNADQRRKAMERCQTIENYYLEKMNLLQQSKSGGGDNPAGFLIRSLQEDWQSPSVFKEQKRKERLQQKRQQEKEIRKLEKQRETLHEKCKVSRQSIIEDLLKEEALFDQLYQDAVAKLGRMKHISIKPGRSKKENYEASPILSSSMNLALEKQFPKAFEQLDNYLKQIEEIDKQLGELRK